MNNENGYFVDEPVEEITAPAMWPNLTANELFDVRTKLYKKADLASHNAILARMIQQSIDRIDLLIAKAISTY